MTDAHTAARGEPMRDGGPAVILHVEPDPRAAELLAAFADRSADGIAVRSVDGMGAALDALDEVDEIDCVVTEQRLPDGSGVELVERLRERGVEVPVAFHTTCCGDETEARALAVGADAYFPKRSERGQHDRLLERLRGLVGEGGRDRGTTATASPGSTAGASASEE